MRRGRILPLILACGAGWGLATEGLADEGLADQRLADPPVSSGLSATSTGALEISLASADEGTKDEITEDEITEDEITEDEITEDETLEADGPEILDGSGAARSSAAPIRARASSLLAEGEDWPAGTVGEQLDRDTTLVPYGKGALFVPALTNPFDEPPVTVLQDGQRIEEGTTGGRIILSPGTYEVRLGSGAVDQRLRYQASIEEGHTTVIPPSWAGLSVHVVDESLGSLRNSYELIRVEDREYIGIGFGTDEQAGEPVTTWILKPGLYKLVRVGDTYRARRDFATVRLVEGYHTHFLLVLVEETGEFIGGGEVPEDELFRVQDGFFGSMVLGGDVSLDSRQGVFAIEDGLYFSFRSFVDARLSFLVLKNPLTLRLQVEEGQTKGPGQPWQKSNDRVDLDGLYIYRLKPWIGPYARLAVETNLLPGYRQESEDVKFQLSPSFGLTSIKEDAGINVRVFKSLFAESNVRTGIGAQHQIANKLFEEVRDVNGNPMDPIVYRPVLSTNQVGVLLTVLAVARLTRWVLVNFEFDTLIPFDTVANALIELEGSVALKLTSYVSVNYVVRFRRNPLFLDTDRLEQEMRLRFSLDVF